MNLSTENINTAPLRYGFTDKNKYVKRNVAVEKESSHECLHSATNIINKNIYSDVDNTYKSLSNLINNKNIVILAADKETPTLNRTNYQNKVNNFF